MASIVEQKIQHLKSQIISNIDGISSRDAVSIQCACGSITTTAARNIYRRWPRSPYRCKSCDVKTYASNPSRIKKFQESFAKVAQTPQHKKKCGQSGKKFWSDPKFEDDRNRVKRSISADNKTNPGKIAGREKASKAFMDSIGLEHLAKIRKIAGESVRKRCIEDPKYVSEISDRFRHALDEPESKERHRRKCADNWKDPEYRERIISKIINTMSEPDHKAMMSKIASDLWKDPEYREKMELILNDPEYKIAASLKSKERWQNNDDLRNEASQRTQALWQDPGYRGKMELILNDPEYCQALSDASKKLWQNTEYRSKLELIMSSEEYKDKMAIVRSQQPKVSSLQTILYSILDDLGVKYYKERPDGPADKECTIGPYNFDCVIPREGKPSLLIECQGEYWHSLDKSIKNDRSKSSYVANNLSGQYELKCLWEHEFKCKDRIAETIKYWMGMTKLELINFKFEDIEIKKSSPNDYRLLLSKYHYLANAGRGGIAYGAYLGEELIGVCVFSSPIRQGVAKLQGCKNDEIRELSRLCIHPRYQKHNFASWFVSRCIKVLPNKYKCIVSYCDTTFNHDGAIYKACNFKLDGRINSDYWYINEDGWVMHKKTLYGHAINLKMKEKDYAESKGYQKVFGKEKLRFVYKRSKDK